MTIIEQLKKIAEVEFKNLPATYDFDSLTAIEQAELLRRTLDEVISQSNTFVEMTLKAFNEILEKGYNIERYTQRINAAAKKYMDAVDYKLKKQNLKIEEFIQMYKDEVIQTVQSSIEEMVAEGELDQVIITAINDANSKVDEMVRKMNALSGQMQSMTVAFDSATGTATKYINKVDEYLAQKTVIENKVHINEGQGYYMIQYPNGFTVDNCIITDVNLSDDYKTWTQENTFTLNGQTIEMRVSLNESNITVVIEDADLSFFGYVWYRIRLEKM